MSRKSDILALRNRIVFHIARIYGVETTAILGRSRATPLADCRVLLAYALSQEGYTRTEVGDALGRDHSSITHCVQLAESRIGFVGWKDFTHKWNALAKEIWADKDAAAAFRARLVKDSAPAGEIILNTFIIKSLKDQSNGKQDSSQN